MASGKSCGDDTSNPISIACNLDSGAANFSPGDSGGRATFDCRQSRNSINPSVSVVILNWNGCADTLACLRSLSFVAYVELDILVVDNGSIDDSVQQITAIDWPHAVMVIETGRNLGYAGGNNVGMRVALDRGADFVLLLNNDTEVAPNFISELVAAAARAPQAAVVGPCIYYYDRPEVLWFAGAAWDDDALAFQWPGQGLRDVEAGTLVEQTAYVCGAAMLFRREALDRIGLLDERFFLVYEESDWCFKARRAGYSCLMAPTARIWHKIGASFGSEQSPLRAYFSTRNQLLWGANNLDDSSRRRLWRRVVLRHVPPLSLGTSSTPWVKRLAWGLPQWWRNAKRMWCDPVQQASRLGLFDYALRRFGDCPAKIRKLNTAWASAQPAVQAALPAAHSSTTVEL